LLEQPRGVDVVAIERELAQLWKRATDDREDLDHGPVVRACTLNLVVVTEEAARLQAIEQLVGEVTLEHPARIFLIHAERDGAPPLLDAWISARCTIAVPGEKQVCCEQITIHAVGAEYTKLPSVVASLLVPDIPSVLLWKAKIVPKDPLLSALSELVDHLLIDSSEEAEPVQLLTSWADFSAANRDAVIPGDLAWSHLTPWRSALGQAFSPAETRMYLQEIATIDIVISTSTQPVHSGASQALLLVSWLAARLGWSIGKTAGGNTASGYTASFTATGGPISFSAAVRQTAGAGPGGIEEIMLRTRTGAVIGLTSSEERSCIRSTITARDGHRHDNVLWARDRDETSVVAQELEVLDRDPVYIAAMKILRSLLGGTS
jgi:glucose-6-phosphate dehydrogenase assembly protein OpcA